MSEHSPQRRVVIGRVPYRNIIIAKGDGRNLYLNLVGVSNERLETLLQGIVTILASVALKKPQTDIRISYPFGVAKHSTFSAIGRKGVPVHRVTSLLGHPPISVMRRANLTQLLRQASHDFLHRSRIGRDTGV